MSAGRWTPSARAAAAERFRRRRANPEFEKKRADGMRRLLADPKFKAKNAARSAERMRRLNADPEFKAKNAERMRRRQADPEFKAKNVERGRRAFAARRAGCPPLAKLPRALKALYQKLQPIVGSKAAWGEIAKELRRASELEKAA